MSTLIKKDCINAVQSAVNNVCESKISHADASVVYDLLVEQLTLALQAGNEVALSGVGRFTTKNVPSHEARNPRTGEMVQVADKRKLMFKAFKSFITAATEA
jgi:DNA-binding protein HU-beta